MSIFWTALAASVYTPATPLALTWEQILTLWESPLKADRSEFLREWDRWKNRAPRDPMVSPAHPWEPLVWEALAQEDPTPLRQLLAWEAPLPEAFQKAGGARWLSLLGAAKRENAAAPLQTLVFKGDTSQWVNALEGPVPGEMKWPSGVPLCFWQKGTPKSAAPFCPDPPPSRRHSVVTFPIFSSTYNLSSPPPKALAPLPLRLVFGLGVGWRGLWAAQKGLHTPRLADGTLATLEVCLAQGPWAACLEGSPVVLGRWGQSRQRGHWGLFSAHWESPNGWQVALGWGQATGPLWDGPRFDAKAPVPIPFGNWHMGVRFAAVSGLRWEGCGLSVSHGVPLGF